MLAKSTPFALTVHSYHCSTGHGTLRSNALFQKHSIADITTKGARRWPAPRVRCKALMHSRNSSCELALGQIFCTPSLVPAAIGHMSKALSKSIDVLPPAFVSTIISRNRFCQYAWPLKYPHAVCNTRIASRTAPLRAATSRPSLQANTSDVNSSKAFEQKAPTASATSSFRRNEMVIWVAAKWEYDEWSGGTQFWAEMSADLSAELEIKYRAG